MKKDFFNGNIKCQFVSYIWTTIIIVAVIFFGCSGLFLYLSFAGNLGQATSLLLLVFGVVSFLFGIWYSLGTIFIIRKYPKYKKITKLFFNSDYYFVGSDSKEYRGRWRGKNAFYMADQLAEQNADLQNIKYPKQYRIFTVLTIIGIVLLFANIVVVWLALENIDILPKSFQSEDAIFVIFMVTEIIDVVLSFAFAFRIKKIRETTIKVYREKQREKRKTDL